jgi:hypothetical protein
MKKYVLKIQPKYPKNLPIQPKDLGYVGKKLLLGIRSPFAAVKNNAYHSPPQTHLILNGILFAVLCHNGF